MKPNRNMIAPALGPVESRRLIWRVSCIFVVLSALRLSILGVGHFLCRFWGVLAILALEFLVFCTLFRISVLHLQFSRFVEMKIR